MKDYIEREQAITVFKTFYGKSLRVVLDALREEHAADVRPVVRGKWKPIDLTYGRNYYFCSACEETVDMPTAMGIPMFRYCPNCGARMEGE